MSASQNQINQHQTAGQLAGIPITLVGVDGVNHLDMPEVRLARALSNSFEGQVPALVNENSNLPTYTGNVALECLQHLSSAEVDSKRKANIVSAVRPLIANKAGKTMVKSLINTLKTESPEEQLQKQLASSGFETAKTAQVDPMFGAIASEAAFNQSSAKSKPSREAKAKKFDVESLTEKLDDENVDFDTKVYHLSKFFGRRITVDPQDFFDKDFFKVGDSLAKLDEDLTTTALESARCKALNNFKKYNNDELEVSIINWAGGVGDVIEQRPELLPLLFDQLTFLNQMAIVTVDEPDRLHELPLRLLNEIFSLCTDIYTMNDPNKRGVMIQEVWSMFAAVDSLPEGCNDKVTAQFNQATASFRLRGRSTGMSSIDKIREDVMKTIADTEVN